MMVLTQTNIPFECNNLHSTMVSFYAGLLLLTSIIQYSTLPLFFVLAILPKRM